MEGYQELGFGCLEQSPRCPDPLHFEIDHPAATSSLRGNASRLSNPNSFKNRSVVE